uniref:MATH domain-containing protein n=1 Tax=Panagrellus redivivus TaxID=6233 RepID=A0A7E4VZ71_PANRE
MAFEFEDTETIVVRADWLNSFEPHQFIETPKRLTSSEHLLWWLRCYPNSIGLENKGHVGVFTYTSIGGFNTEFVVTIDRSEIKDSHVKSYDNPMKNGKRFLASHDDIRSGQVIQNGSFVIRCKVNFKFNLEKLRAPIPSCEDSCIVKVDRKTLETYQPGQGIIEQKQTVDDITWWIRYFPNGTKPENKGHVSIFFYIIGGPVNMKCSCAMPIGGSLIKHYFSADCEQDGARGMSNCFSHNQCNLANSNNGIIDLVCTVKFRELTKQVSTLTPPSTKTAQDKKRNKRCIKDTITTSFLECQLNGNVAGDYNSTDMKFAKGSDKHQWRVLHFPAGILAPSNGYIGLIVEATTTDTITVIMNGVIRIEGSPFEKKFSMLVEKDSSQSFPKLISHEDLRRNGGIIDSKITITCEATFEEYLFII